MNRFRELARETRSASGRLYQPQTVVTLCREFGEGDGARAMVRVARTREILVLPPSSLRPARHVAAVDLQGLTPREEIALAPAWVREALRGSAPESSAASAAFALLAILALLWVVIA